MSEKIKSLIKAEIEAKHAFQAAQRAVREEINVSYPKGADAVIETDEVISGLKVAIRVEKKGDDADSCSWTKYKIVPPKTTNL